MVDGWDDPRILTLNGLRRRGYTADSINEFCDLVSVTRRGNENITELHLLEHCIRKDLDIKVYIYIQLNYVGTEIYGHFRPGTCDNYKYTS